MPAELSAVAHRNRSAVAPKRLQHPARVVIRYAFEFRQEGKLVYVGDQSAMFVRGIAIG